MRQRRRGRSGSAAATLMTRADRPRLAACVRRLRSCSSVSKSSASVSMNNVTNIGCMMLFPFSCFTPRRPAGRGQGGAERSPGHREGVRPSRRTRSLHCTAGSIPARGDRPQCGRHRGPGGQPGGTGVGVNTWRTSGLGAAGCSGPCGSSRGFTGSYGTRSFMALACPGGGQGRKRRRSQAQVAKVPGLGPGIWSRSGPAEPALQHGL